MTINGLTKFIERFTHAGHLFVIKTNESVCINKISTPSELGKGWIKMSNLFVTIPQD